MELTDRQQKLFKFVIEQHGDQKRKYGGEPYYLHLYRVAELCQKYTKDAVPEYELSVEIALCHDLLEDTKCTLTKLVNVLNELGYKFREDTTILSAVQELTDKFIPEDYPGVNRRLRKLMEAGRLANISRVAQTVKCADIVDNTHSIVEHDHKFARIYLEEIEELLSKLRGGRFELYALAVHTWWIANENLKTLNGKTT